MTKVFPPRPMIQTTMYMSGMRTPVMLGPEASAGPEELVEFSRVSLSVLSLNMSRNRGRPEEGPAQLLFSHASSVISVPRSGMLPKDSPFSLAPFSDASAPSHLLCERRKPDGDHTQQWPFRITIEIHSK